MSQQNPPYDDSAPCPFCPMEVRNLLAVAHNLSIGAHDTTVADLKAAVELCRPLADAHFANVAHAIGGDDGSDDVEEIGPVGGGV